jgi:predicted methyltransferase
MKPAQILTVLLVISTNYAMADLAEGFDEALVATERSEENRNRDTARMPREVLEFVGIEAGMTVLDVAAGAGWYTEVLAVAVGSEGHVISHNSFGYGPRNAETVAAIAQRSGNVTMLFAAYGHFRLDAEVDAAITGLNLHDFQNRSAEEAQVFLSGIYRALKPGGVLGLTDHEGSATLDNAALHRIELSTATEALERAGFIVEATSDLLDNQDDDHTLIYSDESLGRNTDRILIRARKPQQSGPTSDNYATLSARQASLPNLPGVASGQTSPIQCGVTE